MKNKFFAILVLTCFSTLNAQLSTAFAQGSLTPPGAPAPAMKSLAQIEPRTPISSAPFTITTSGSYYLTTNLSTGSSQAGIVILADNVTLDLNGFALIGVPNSFSGIICFGQKNICIRNGTIRGWDNDGILAVPSSNQRYENLFITDNTTGGLLADKNALVVGCTVSGNAGGISVGDGSSVNRCIVSTNSGNGIFTGRGCAVSECVAAYNTGVGISADTGSTLTSVTALANGSHGISAADSCTVQTCTSSGNTGDGVHMGSSCTLRGCTLRSNLVNGVYLNRTCLVIENLVDQTGRTNFGTVSISANGANNRIDSNQIINDPSDRVLALHFGVAGTNNLVFRNSFVLGNSLFTDGPGGIIGPFINSQSVILTNSYPWANFAF